MSSTNHSFVSLGQHRGRASACAKWPAWVLMFLAVTIPAVLAHAATPLPAKFTTGQLFFIGEDFRQDLTVTCIAYGDFNKDGKLDLVSAGGAGPAFSVMLGNGDGTFQAGNVISLPTGSGSPEYVAVGDVNP